MLIDIAPVTGAKSNIPTASAAQISTADVPVRYGVQVKAADANTGNIYVGGVGITAGTADATDGFELASGESILVPVTNVDKVYVIASASGQKAFWMVA